MSPLALAAIRLARSFVTGKSLEIDGPNDGPEIREWLSAVAIHRPAAWCAAFLTAMIRQAARDVGVVAGLKFRGSASALRLVDLNPTLIMAEPEIGCVAVLDHRGGLGHVGFVPSVVYVERALTSYVLLSGNTNAAGSRDANQVCEGPRDFPGPHPITWLRVA